MHRAVILEGTLDTTPRRFRWWLAWFPWEWPRAFDGSAQRAAREGHCAYIHFGVDCVIHVASGTYAVPWRDTRALAGPPMWRIEAGGLVLELPDGHLAAWERRRLLSSTRFGSA